MSARLSLTSLRHDITDCSRAKDLLYFHFRLVHLLRVRFSNAGNCRLLAARRFLEQTACRPVRAAPQTGHVDEEPTTPLGDALRGDLQGKDPTPGRRWPAHAHPDGPPDQVEMETGHLWEVNPLIYRMGDSKSWRSVHPVGET